jgi:ubiquinone/menaquinone biosynthesis C-methylase UbiE
MLTRQKIESIYTDRYAGIYDALYLEPWLNKHRWNIRKISEIISQYPEQGILWLDACCGQAWHFSQFPNRISKIGVDISLPQLRLAKKKNPDAFFLQSDILKVPFKSNVFYLVTCFWGAYCYLDSIKNIGAFLDNAVSWTKENGTLYMEVLLPTMLESFNDSSFAHTTNFRVVPESDNYHTWSYTDCGGKHIMTSPPLEFFTSRLQPFFSIVNAEYDNGFMIHLIASNKRGLGSVRQRKGRQ